MLRSLGQDIGYTTLVVDPGNTAAPWIAVVSPGESGEGQAQQNKPGTLDDSSESLLEWCTKVHISNSLFREIERSFPLRDDYIIL